MLVLTGYTSQIGRRIVARNSEIGKNAMLIGRRDHSGIRDKGIYSVCVDLKEEDSVDLVCNSLRELEPNEIDLLFLHRYRPKGENEYCLTDAMLVDVGIPIKLIDAIVDSGLPLRSVMLGNSLLSDSVDISVPIGYHIVKASLTSATKYLAVKYRQHGIAVNSAKIGYVAPEVNGGSRKPMISDSILPSGKTPTAEGIANAILSFIYREDNHITGGVIPFDECLSVMSPAFTARKAQ